MSVVMSVVFLRLKILIHVPTRLSARKGRSWGIHESGIKFLPITTPIPKTRLRVWKTLEVCKIISWLSFHWTAVGIRPAVVVILVLVLITRLEGRIFTIRRGSTLPTKRIRRGDTGIMTTLCGHDETLRRGGVSLPLLCGHGATSARVLTIHTEEAWETIPITPDLRGGVSLPQEDCATSL